MKISTIIKSSLAITEAQGEKVRDRVIKKLSNNKRVTLDFGGLICFSVSFIRLVAEIYQLYDPELLKKRVRFININRFSDLVLRNCISEAINIRNNNLNKNLEVQ